MQEWPKPEKRIYYSKGYKYQLRKDHVQVLPDCFKHLEFDNGFLAARNGLMLIRAGYAWNGCSGPTFDTPTNMRGGLRHDAYYQMCVEGLIDRSFKDEMDDELRNICLEDGMNKFRAKYFHIGVDWFGKDATIRNTQIIIAP
jgi:hypothetical protein